MKTSRSTSRLSRNSRWIGLAAACTMLHHAAAIVMAQQPAGDAEETGGALPWLISGGVMIVICLPAFINPKRSHQD